jgi:hypothetical protein
MHTSDALFSGPESHGSYPSSGWSDTISAVTWIGKGAAMNPLQTGEASEAAHGNSDLEKRLAEVLRQRAAISVPRE